MAENAVCQPLLDTIAGHLGRDGGTGAALDAVLGHVLDSFGCAAGTVHDLDASAGLLHLRAQRGIPEVVLERVRVVPIGKGMAGLAAQRREPVQVCNLQADTSGHAKPSARETKMEGCIAVPMLAADRLHGVLGIAKPVAYEFSEAETTLLLRVAAIVGEYLASSGRAEPS